MKATLCHPASAAPANRLLAGSAVTLACDAAGRLAYFLTHVLLARVFGPEVFGIYVLGWTVVGLLDIVAPLGVPEALARFATAHYASDRRRFREIAAPLLAMAMLSGLLLSLALAGAARPIAEGVFAEPALALILLAFAPALLLRTMLQTVAALTRTSLRFHYASLAGLTRHLGGMLLVLAFVSGGLEPLEAVYAHLLSLIAAVGVALCFAWRLDLLDCLHWRGMRLPPREILAFSLKSMLVYGIVVLNLWVDRLMIGALAGPLEVGIYQPASQLAMLSLVVLSAMKVVFEPTAARQHLAGDRTAVAASHLTSTRWGVHLLLPPMAVLILAPSSLVHLLFGEAYAAAATPLLILSVGQLAVAFCGPAVVMLAMTGREGTALGLALASLVANVGLNGLMIPAYGATGAAIASALANGGLAVAGLFLARPEAWPGGMRHVTVAALAGLAGAWAFLQLVAPGPLSSCLGMPLVAAAVYWLVLTWIGDIGEERMALAAVVGRLRRSVLR